MNTSLQEILKQSSFAIEEDVFVYCKVAVVPTRGDHFLVAKDRDEITVITKEEQAELLALIEKNKSLWKLICLQVSTPFYATGFLAAVSSAVAQKNINGLIVSTYSKDYLLVREETLDQARQALLEIGLREDSLPPNRLRN